MTEDPVAGLQRGRHRTPAAAEPCLEQSVRTWHFVDREDLPEPAQSGAVEDRESNPGTRWDPSDHVVRELVLDDNFEDVPAAPYKVLEASVLGEETLESFLNGQLGHGVILRRF